MSTEISIKSRMPDLTRPPKKPKRKIERRLVCRYDYRLPTGKLFFQKERYEIVNPEPGGRTKDFGYFRNVWDVEARYKKPEGADGILYNLPAVLAAILAGDPIHWVEGEKDADAINALALAATTVHQGANKVTIAQAAWLRGAAEVFIWVDKDVEHPEVGAHDAVMRYNHLIDIGVTAPITFLRAPGPWGVLKDPADMLAAGHTLDDAETVNPNRLARVAAKWTPSQNRRLGYARP